MLLSPSCQYWFQPPSMFESHWSWCLNIKAGWETDFLFRKKCHNVKRKKSGARQNNSNSESSKMLCFDTIKSFQFDCVFFYTLKIMSRMFWHYWAASLNSFPKCILLNVMYVELFRVLSHWKILFSGKYFEKICMVKSIEFRPRTLGTQFGKSLVVYFLLNIWKARRLETFFFYLSFSSFVPIHLHNPPARLQTSTWLWNSGCGLSKYTAQSSRW